MAIKFSLPKKKTKKPAENVNILDNSVTKPKKSLFAKRQPKKESLTESIKTGKNKKLDKKTMSLIGALLVLLCVGAVVMFVLPMFAEPEPTPTPTTSEPVATVEATPEETASTPASTPTDAPATEASPTPPEPVQEEATTPPVPASATTETSTDKPNVEQKLMDEASNQAPKPTNAEPAVKETTKTMSYADFVKASEQKVFVDR